MLRFLDLDRLELFFLLLDDFCFEGEAAGATPPAAIGIEGALLLINGPRVLLRKKQQRKHRQHTTNNKISTAMMGPRTAHSEN